MLQAVEAWNQLDRPNNESGEFVMGNVPEGHVKSVCRPCATGCCSFLVMGGGGWNCAKGDGFSGIRILIDQRRAERSMRAMGDNCSGPPHFELNQPDAAKAEGVRADA